MKMFADVHLHIIPYLNLPSAEEAAAGFQNYSCEEIPNGLTSTSVSSMKIMCIDTYTHLSILVMYMCNVLILKEIGFIDRLF